MVFSSWSGGKDSALALYRALKDFKEVEKVDILFTMFDENCERTRAHGLPKALIQAQAESIGAKSVIRCASWESYESEFLKFLEEYAKGGIGIFGDIDLQEHRDWVERVCGTYNVKALEPLWLEKREKLLEEFLNLGFKAIIVAVKNGFEDLLGLDLHSRETIKLIEKLGWDLSGENGEYHTFVYDGPIFKEPINFKIVGKHVTEKNAYLVLDI
ncbi:diphthine--ammonia ligase [Fervidobacterium nodosum]|uniref:Putative ATP binding protein n=1 Tax=Fervidobacterium nodosum (strain ATCC 35602 / DSM 5306 / Rt17-B1) TaxID=381764 RepID=A7HMT6_FERNB|nr:diphthine--ammonia ligase [Fervidobacterium nodosum]ABS61219.1 putative ATP binding protein [Fervidobacterium nodosum Rt17-B1]PHJ13954.1 ATP-binding protein [Fervidobacterium sp. SC_NGM5_G05]